MKSLTLEEAAEWPQRPVWGYLQEQLRTGFANIGATEGLSALRALNKEWEGLQAVLQVKKATDPLSLGYAAALASETYQRGLSVLNDALQLMTSAGLTEWKRLTEEVDAANKDNEQQQIRRGMLEHHERQLRLLDQLQLDASHLVYQARRCEECLRKTRVEIATMRFGDAGKSVDVVVDALNSTIRQAKEVQEELKRVGY